MNLMVRFSCKACGVGRRSDTDSIHQHRQMNNLPSLPTIQKYLPNVKTWGMDCTLHHTDITKWTVNYTILI